MDSAISVSREIKKEFKLSLRNVLLLSTILFLIILAGGFYYYKYIFNPLSIPFSNKGYQLHQTVAQTFKRSDKYQALITQTDKAILEEDPKVQYQLLTNLFKQLKVAYKDSKEGKIIAATYQLKNYASTLKDFQEEDFIIRLER